MDSQSMFLDIKNFLEKKAALLNDIYAKKAEKISTEEIRLKLEHFMDTEAEKFKKEINQVITILDSPINVGLLGRYSHGKTSLLNSLFELPEEQQLAEGEGVVTSRITKVDFSKNISNPKCFEYCRNGEKHLISLSDLQASVSGQGKDDASLIDYYHLQMPCKGPFADIFESNQISLIDMPGLGGPYFKDTEITRKYLENLEMLIIVIKITEIEQASRYIEPYIVNMLGKGIPMIPVLTFSDMAMANPIFVDCTDDEQIVEKAKKLLLEYIPSLAKHMTRCIVVSAKTGKDINSLRELILNFVIEKNLAIEKIKKEGPVVLRRKVDEVQKSLEFLLKKSENSLVVLNKDLESILPESGKFDRFSKEFEKKKERFFKDVKGKFSRTTRDLFANFKEMVSGIEHKMDYDAINGEIRRITQEINMVAFKDLRQEIDGEFENMKEKIYQDLEKYINLLEIGKINKDELKENAHSIVKSASIDLKVITYSPPNTLSKFLTDYAKTFFELFVGMFKTPTVLIPLALGFLFLTVFPSSFLGITLYSKPIGLFLIIATFVSAMLLDTSIKKKNFYEQRKMICEQLLSDFNPQKYQECAIGVLNDATNRLLEELDESLDDDRNQFQKDIKIIQEISKNLRNVIDDIQNFITRAKQKMDN
jgi:predicted GTPase